MMSAVIGWWDFDPGTQALVNRTTQQRVTLLGSLTTEDAPIGLVWPDFRWGAIIERAGWRFDYRDHDVYFPLVVTTIATAFYKGVSKHFWLLDYEASAELWRRGAGVEG